MTAQVKFWLLQTEVTIEVKTMEGKKKDDNGWTVSLLPIKRVVLSHSRW